MKKFVLSLITLPFFLCACSLNGGDKGYVPKTNPEDGGKKEEPTPEPTPEPVDPIPEPTPEPTPDGDENNIHGPEGSKEVDWYIVGSGSLWEKDNWEISEGIRLFSNPDNSEDLGCILSIPFEVGDLFKVTNQKDWFGYEKIDRYNSPSNMGITNFVGENDNYNGENIKCTKEGTYDIYINKSGTFWIELAK